MPIALHSLEKFLQYYQKSAYSRKEVPDSHTTVLLVHCIPDQDQLHGITTHGAGTGIKVTVAPSLRPQNLVDYFIINEYSEVCLKSSYHRPGLILVANLNLAII